MKCRKCGKTIQHEYAKEPVQKGGKVDYGANAEKVQANPRFNYYHRKCFKQRIIEVNQK